MNESTITPEDLERAILPKSDQINADDLIAGPITVRILAVRGGNLEQPIAIAIEGHKPYMPCKSMLRVLTLCWGSEARAWLGRALTLYRDPEVVFGGVKVGGIRISHMSGLDEPKALALTTTKGRRAIYRVEPLVATRPAPALVEILASIGATVEDADRWRAANSKPAISTSSDEDRAKIAAFLTVNPPALEKARAWFAANPRPTAAPESEDTP